MLIVKYCIKELKLKLPIPERNLCRKRLHVRWRVLKLDVCSVKRSCGSMETCQIIGCYKNTTLNEYVSSEKLQPFFYLLYYYFTSLYITIIIFLFILFRFFVMLVVSFYLRATQVTRVI